MRGLVRRFAGKCPSAHVTRRPLYSPFITGQTTFLPDHFDLVRRHPEAEFHHDHERSRDERRDGT
jgi:hypothetical protein